LIYINDENPVLHSADGIYLYAIMHVLGF